MNGKKSEQKRSDPKQSGRPTPIEVYRQNKKNDAEKSKQKSKKRMVQKWLAKFVEPLTVVTLLLFGATTALYWATRNLVHDAAQTAQQEMRAYVYLTITAKKFPSELKDETGKIIQKPDRYGITLNLINAGKTWAQNLVVRMTHIPQTGEDDRWNTINWKELEDKPFTLGPNQQIGLQLDNVWFVICQTSSAARWGSILRLDHVRRRLQQSSSSPDSDCAANSR